MHVCMVVKSDLGLDTRVQREAVALLDAGHTVTVIAVAVSQPVDDRIEVLEVASVAPVSSAGSAGRGALRTHVRRPARWLLLPEHRARAEARFARDAVELARQLPTIDVVHGHDLTGLVPAATIADERGAALVHDAHECWSGRRLVGRPDPRRRARERELEARLTARADAVLTVSPGIAAWFAEHLGRDDVQVVRNTFPARAQHEPIGTAGVAYAGLVKERRDLETFRAACRLQPGARDATDRWSGTIIGAVDAGFRFDPAPLRQHDHVAADDVDGLLRRHGIALVPMVDDCLNHRLALPNKLFHAVRAGVPVVAADLPEMASLVRRTGIGALYRPGDPVSLDAAVRRVRDDHEAHVGAVEAAQEELSWSLDSARLIEVYRWLSAGRVHA